MELAMAQRSAWIVSGDVWSSKWLCILSAPRRLRMHRRGCPPTPHPQGERRVRGLRPRTWGGGTPLTQGSSAFGCATLGYQSVNRPKRAVTEDFQHLSNHAWTCMIRLHSCRTSPFRLDLDAKAKMGKDTTLRNVRLKPFGSSLLHKEKFHEKEYRLYHVGTGLVRAWMLQGREEIGRTVQRNRYDNACHRRSGRSQTNFPTSWM